MKKEKFQVSFLISFNSDVASNFSHKVDYIQTCEKTEIKYCQKKIKSILTKDS